MPDSEHIKTVASQSHNGGALRLRRVAYHHHVEWLVEKTYPHLIGTAWLCLGMYKRRKAAVHAWENELLRASTTGVQPGQRIK
jgi:hypothetical protein